MVLLQLFFFASLSEYDQKLNEDHKTNRMSEALKLFQDISNYKLFVENDTALILFLNKKDLFKKKLKEVPLNVYFTDYTGPNEYDKACQYVRREFLKLSPKGKQVHVYKTCATDTDNIRIVFRTVKEHILNANMKTLGIYVVPNETAQPRRQRPPNPAKPKPKPDQDQDPEEQSDEEKA